MRFAAIALACVLSSPAYARADPALRLLTGLECKTHGGEILTLAPGRYVPEKTWLDYEAESDRLKVAEARLTAENTSLKKSISETSMGWGTATLVTGALAVGISIGLFR